MILASPILNLRPTICGRFSKPLAAVTIKPFLGCSISSTKSSSTLLKCHCCTHNKDTDKSTQGFSVLTSDIPWKTGSLWSTMALYMLNLHIPLGFGGLSIVAYILHQHVLDPQTQALSLLVIDILELLATLFLLNSTIRPEKRLVDIFGFNSVERNWLLASALGFGILIFIVFLTSIVIDGLFGVKQVILTIRGFGLEGFLDGSISVPSK
ncbi:hypothetical protein V6N13_114734 [Hibiscus sabdariffa]